MTTAPAVAGVKRGGGEIEPAAKRRKLEGDYGAAVEAPKAARAVTPVGGAAAGRKTPTADGELVAARRSPLPSGRKSTSPSAALQGRKTPTPAATPAKPPSPPRPPSRPKTPPDLPDDPPGSVRCLCTFSASASTASVPRPVVMPPASLTPAEAAAELQGWRHQLGLAPPPKAPNPLLMLTGPDNAAAPAHGQATAASAPVRFGVKAKKAPRALLPVPGIEQD